MGYVKYTKEILEPAVKQSISFAGVLRILGLVQSGGTQCHIKKRTVQLGIDFAHFTGQKSNKGKSPSNKQSATEILVLNDKDYREKTHKLIRALIEIGRPYKCVECGIEDVYNNKPLTLQIDHIDGNSRNNKESNIRFICPMCHSQTDTFCRNKNGSVAKRQTQ